MLRPTWVAEKIPVPANSVLFDSTRSAEPPTIVGVKGFSACITVRPASRVATSSPAGNTGSASRQPSRGSPRRSSSRSFGESRERSRPRSNAPVPLALQLGAARQDGGHVLAHEIGDGERRVGIEPHHLLRRPDLGLAERRSVRLRGVDRVRRRVRDVRPEDDQRGAVFLGLGCRERAEERVEILGVVDVLDVPAVGLEALALVLGREREGRRAVDRDVVVVVDVDEPTEAEVAGDRGGLLGDALHHVAVGADRVDPRVDDLVMRPVVAVGEEALRDRHPDAVREALAERPGRRLDAGGVAPLGVAGRPRAPLPELLQVVEREVVAREMERRVLEDARVTGGEDEAVAARPVRIGRVVAHHVAVEEVGDGRERHRRAGVPGVRLLHRIHRERANRVDRLGAGVRGHGLVEHIARSVAAASTLGPCPSLIASNLRKELSGDPLFDGISFSVDRGQRLALAGQNGAGKTTLLRALVGETTIQGGEIALQKGARIALHDQRPPRDRGLTLREYSLSGAAALVRIEAGAARARAGDGHAATHDEATLRRYSEAQARLEHAGGWGWRDRAASMLRGLGFRDADLDRQLSTFSGGELTRASLARALAGDPDLLLLDEPTNHLDVESLEWLERELTTIDAAVILVAHDRWFLESVTTAVLELEGGRGLYFSGPWHQWRLERAARAQAAAKSVQACGA